jgi:hypothetical protein
MSPEEKPAQSYPMSILRPAILSLVALMPISCAAMANSLKDSPPARIVGDANPATIGETRRVLRTYGSIPGGVVLEGVGRGLEWVDRVSFDAGRNAFVLNDRVSYASPVSPEAAATLLRAIASDDRIGVSLRSKREIVYGRLAPDSEVAIDLKLVDNFLGDIILPPQYWTLGYRYANGFKPVGTSAKDAPAVFFQFDDFAFAVKGETLRLANADFHVRLVPVTTALAKDGGYLPDLRELASFDRSSFFLTNARHVAGNISYYAREDIVRKAFSYGEAAAFFRALKTAKIDLNSLEKSVDSSASVFRVARLIKMLGLESHDLETHWQRYLRTIQYRGHIANWTSPPYDLYRSRN